MSGEKRRSSRIPYPWLAFLVPLGIYLYTLAPSAMWGDSAKYVLAAEQVAWPIDAGYHPLYHLVSAIWMTLCPTDLALWLNVLSALLGAASCLLLYRLLEVEGVRAPIAFFATLGLAFSHVHWHVSVMAESYSLTLLVFLAIVHLLRTRFEWENTSTADGPTRHVAGGPLFVVAFLTGLLICNFLLMIAYAGVFFAGVAWVLARPPRRPRLVVWGSMALVTGCGLVLGTALIWAPLVHQVARGDVPLDVALDAALNGRYASTFFWDAPVAALKRLALLSGITAYEFPSPLLLFAGVGAVALVRRSRIWGGCLLLVVAGTYLFCSTYMIQRAVFILLPALALIVYLGGVGIEALLARQRSSSRRMRMAVASVALAPLIAYPLFVHAAGRLGVDPIPGRELAYRDNVEYFLLPSKRAYRGPELFSREAFTIVPAGGCIVADFTPHVVLRYYQRQLGPGVDVLFSEAIGPEEFQKLLRQYVDGGQGLYLADDEPAAYPVAGIVEPYRLERVGNFYRVVK